MPGGVSQAAIFAFTGIHSMVYWVVVHPTSEVTAAQATWPYVLWFSATLLLLGIAVFIFGRMVGGDGVRRWANVALAAISIASVANIIEDGLRVEGAFFFFILSGLAFDIALMGLAIAIARTAHDRHRLLAAIPMGTLAAILFFATAGGPVLAVTWLLAAAAAVFMPLASRGSQAAS